jgi:hypothetical protein
MRNWDNVSGYEFQGITGHLLGEELGLRFERFGPGRDGGVDLRHLNDNGPPDIVQCKHYKGSSWSQLKRATKAEAKRLAKLEHAPARYWFVTSQSLTPARKTELFEILSPFAVVEDDIYGRDDLEDLLDRHPTVERTHVKLWLASGPQLQALLRPGVHARSRALAEQVNRALPLYVQGASFVEAQERLAAHHVCVIAGPPGVGKTTLAHMLVADAIGQGYEPIDISHDIDEAWDAWNRDARQIFVYDDFLGQTMLSELRKNEPSRLIGFLSVASQSANTAVVLTTREYILNKAARMYEVFQRHGLPDGPLVLPLEKYSSLERAEILRNHIWHSASLPDDVLEALWHERAYLKIVDHPNFNPRIIEYVTGLQPGHSIDETGGRAWLSFAVRQLDHPDDIWKTAFEEQLGEVERALLMTLATMPARTNVDDLRLAFDAFTAAAGTSRPRFAPALDVLEGSFVTSSLEPDESIFISTLNPGLRDFLERQLLDDPSTIRASIAGAAFFEQLMLLWRMLGDLPDSSARRAVTDGATFATSAARVLSAKSSMWGTVRIDETTSRVGRYHGSPEARLVLLAGVASATNPPEGLDDLLRLEFERAAARWDEGLISARAALDLARMFSRDAALAPSNWERRLAAAMLADPVDVEHWDAIFTLRQILPDVITDDDLAGLRDAFGAYSYDYLTSDIPVEAFDEISQLEDIAQQLDTKVDPELLSSAREQVERRLAHADALADEQLEDYKITRHAAGLERRRDQDEMDTMFKPDA